MTEETKKFIAHWEAVGKERTGWAADPGEWEPVMCPLLPKWDDPDRHMPKIRRSKPQPEEI